MSGYKQAYKRFQEEVRAGLAEESRLSPHSPVRPSVAARLYRVSLVTAAHHHATTPTERKQLADAALAFVQEEACLPRAVLAQAIRLDRKAVEAFDEGLDDSGPRASLDALDSAYAATARYA